MSIIIIGLGNVGSKIRDLCDKKQIPVKVMVSRHNPLATHQKISEVAIDQNDTVIDFSSPEAILEHVDFIARKGGNIVIGTTRWEKDADSIKNIVHKSNIGFAFTPNYLPEVHAFWKAVSVLSEELGRSSPDAFCATVSEVRLKTKKSYSGTAKHTTQILENQKGLDFKLKKNFQWSLTGKKPIDISVTFRSDATSFNLRFASFDHEKNDKMYAKMALKTAMWLHGKQGFFELDSEMIEEICSIRLDE